MGGPTCASAATNPATSASKTPHSPPASNTKERSSSTGASPTDGNARSFAPGISSSIPTTPTNPNSPKAKPSAAVSATLSLVHSAVLSPSRPGPVGGQWMKEVCDLDRRAKNYGWCFDGVPEENSLLLDFGGTRFEIPSLDLVFSLTSRPARRRGSCQVRRRVPHPLRFPRYRWAAATSRSRSTR